MSTATPEAAATASPAASKGPGEPRPLPSLVGMYDSPFVRRVAVSLRLLGMDYEHHDWSVGREAKKIRGYNPLGRVPALALTDGSTLIDSAAILDWLDEQAGPNALLPAAGAARREALQCMALATGAVDKTLAQLFELLRPAALRYPAWSAHCLRQVRGALDALEARAVAADAPNGGWLAGERLSQADITVVCALGFVREATPQDLAPWPALSALVARCEALPEFAACYQPFARPQD